MNDINNRKNIVALYAVSAIVCLFTLAIVRGHFLNFSQFSIALYVLYPLSFVASMATLILLKRVSNEDQTWLPSFVATTVFKALTTCVISASIAVGARTYHEDNMAFVAVYSGFPIFIIVCLLSSIIAFIIAFLVARFLIKSRNITASSFDRTKAIRTANVVSLLLGLLLASFIYICG